MKRTGLAAPTIRIWEKRYGAVKPGRTETNRRLYSGEDVTRLGLLRSLTERGHSIRNIANLELPQLQKQLAEDEQAGAMVSSDSVSPSRRGRVLIVGKAAATLLSGSAACIFAIARHHYEGRSQAPSAGRSALFLWTSAK